MADIDRLAQAATAVRGRAALTGELGAISVETCLSILRDPAATEDEKRVALWLHRGGAHVFIQDADSLALPAERVARILTHLCQTFPSVNRVTTYARSRTLVAKSIDQLKTLRSAGLTRIHIGVESGSKDVLALIQKGATPEHHVEGCRRAIEAGFEVCCYVMPGLGGRQFTHAHADETATVLKAIGPKHIRLRTMWIVPGSPLDDMHRAGAFQLLEEDDVVAEIMRMLDGLVGADSQIVSDHDFNLLMEIEGHATDDAALLKQTCEAFLALSPEKRDAFIVARRTGHARSLNAFLKDPTAIQPFIAEADRLKKIGSGSLVKGLTMDFIHRSI